MSASLPELHLLTDGDYDDYRPAIGSTGDVVIFERTPRSGGRTVLYRITDFATPNPQPFLSDPPLPTWQTRPDWCWHTGMIAFNGASAGHGPLDVWLASEIGAASPLGNASGFTYPTWNSDGSRLVAMNASASASPQPCSSILDMGGKVGPININGTDTAGTLLYGGMPAAKPGEWPLIAFAGQPAIDGWGGTGKNAYDQNFNYIFLNSPNNGDTFTSRPMEPDAPLTAYDPGYQGRAPAWSPDGRTIAFESNRIGSRDAIYLCDVESGTITQVTDPALGAQHAKFFPCGTKLILCGRRQGGWAVAWVDISNWLKS